MTREEFERRYAERSGVTIEWLHDAGQFAEICNCGEPGCQGWQMKSKKEVCLVCSRDHGEWQEKNINKGKEKDNEHE